MFASIVSPESAKRSESARIAHGHAFGLPPTKGPIPRWPRLVEEWLTTIGMTSANGRGR